jgi:metal-sulfur cluster biosynthetic enzyme
MPDCIALPAWPPIDFRSFYSSLTARLIPCPHPSRRKRYGRGFRKRCEYMSGPTENLILERLKAVKFPGYSRDIVSFGLVKELKVSGSDVFVRLQVATTNPSIPETLKRDTEGILRETPGISSTKVVIDITNPPEVATPAQTGTSEIAGVKYVIAVASGKGGVGKSTVAANGSL